MISVSIDLKNISLLLNTIEIKNKTIIYESKYKCFLTL